MTQSNDHTGPAPVRVEPIESRSLALSRRRLEAARKEYEDGLAIARYVEAATKGDASAFLWDYRDAEGSR